jgi:hypothetical protein
VAIPTERIESVKAGLLGAVAFAIAEIITFSCQHLAIPLGQLGIFQVAPGMGNLELILHLVIGAIAGFLFGVTYRYIIRDDHNSHLNDGAVLAFGLVRGLALIESSITLFDWSMVIIILQSLICFAFTRWLLDRAIAKKIIKPFV